MLLKERERIKENKRLEKTLVRQRKLEQQHYERMIARELKKPIDDMSLKDLRPLPNLPSIPNLHISGKAYADILMVNEFIQTFGHVLDVGINIIKFSIIRELNCFVNMKIIGVVDTQVPSLVMTKYNLTLIN